MSIDLTAAIEAARDFIEGEVGFDGGPAMRDQAAALVATLAPLIERAVREQVARDIEVVDPVEWALAGQCAGADAARIARGEVTP